MNNIMSAMVLVTIKPTYFNISIRKISIISVIKKLYLMKYSYSDIGWSIISDQNKVPTCKVYIMQCSYMIGGI